MAKEIALDAEAPFKDVDRETLEVMTKMALDFIYFEGHGSAFETFNQERMSEMLDAMPSTEVH